MSELPALYQITQSYRQLLDMDLPEEQLADTLALVNDEFQEKAKQVGFVMQTMSEQELAIAAHLDHVKARLAALKSRRERLKEYLKTNMDEIGITKIECPYFVLSIQSNPPAAVIDDELDIPGEYVEEVVTVKVNKALIRQDLLKGIQIPGAHLEQGTHLRIK